jgi:hypothetical protein
VSNVFTKVNDDGVKPFESDTLYEKLTLWQQQNGWAIMLSWLSNGPQKNITVRDATVVHDGHYFDWSVSGCDPCRPNQATIGAVHGGDSVISDVLVENVVMETQVWRPVWIGIDKSSWAKQGTGTLMNWNMRDIKVLGGGQKASEIVGTQNSNQVNGVTFYDFEDQAKNAKTCEDMPMLIIGATENVKMSGSNQPTSPCAPSPPPPPPAFDNDVKLNGCDKVAYDLDWLSIEKGQYFEKMIITGNDVNVRASRSLSGTPAYEFKQGLSDENVMGLKKVDPMITLPPYLFFTTFGNSTFTFGNQTVVCRDFRLAQGKNTFGTYVWWVGSPTCKGSGGQPWLKCSCDTKTVKVSPGNDGNTFIVQVDKELENVDIVV